MAFVLKAHLDFLNWSREGVEAKTLDRRFMPWLYES